VQLLRNVSKSFGVRTICRIIGFDPSKDRIVYAGDDENDDAAMRWVLRKGGTAFSVGGAARVPGARTVENPVALARAVEALADIPPRHPHRLGVSCPETSSRFQREQTPTFESGRSPAPKKSTRRKE